MKQIEPQKEGLHVNTTVENKGESQKVNPEGAIPGLQLPIEARKIFRRRNDANPFAVIVDNNQETDRMQR